MGRALEGAYKTKLHNRLRRMFPGCEILKNDAGFLQGVPDTLILWEDQWATLEVKRDADSEIQPNQQYYVEKMNQMSFSAFIYPEIEEEVLDALQSAFYRRSSRISQR